MSSSEPSSSMAPETLQYPWRSGRVFDQALWRLGQYIAKNATPGQLFLLDQIATEYHISKPTAREVVKSLQGRGMVTVKSGVGIQVTEVGSWHLLDPYVLYWRSRGPMAIEQLRDLLSLRQITSMRLGTVNDTSQPDSSKSDNGIFDTLWRQLSMRIDLALSAHLSSIDIASKSREEFNEIINLLAAAGYCRKFAD